MAPLLRPISIELQPYFHAVGWQIDIVLGDSVCPGQASLEPRSKTDGSRECPFRVWTAILWEPFRAMMTDPYSAEWSISLSPRVKGLTSDLIVWPFRARLMECGLNCGQAMEWLNYCWPPCSEKHEKYPFIFFLLHRRIDLRDSYKVAAILCRLPSPFLNL